MIDHLIAERYATALSLVIEDDRQLDTAAADLEALSLEFSHHHDLHACLSNPAIAAELREHVLDHVLEKMGVMVQVRNLVHELMNRGRVLLLPAVAKLFSEIADERQGRITAQVMTALPLTPPQEAKLRESLAAYTGKQVRLQCAVEPELLSGVVAHVGGEVIDDSLRTRLTNLRNALISGELA